MITKLKIKNWKSYLEANFEFTKGVNVLVGEMGSGKSSAMDAICFGLFGITPSLQNRNLRFDNFIRRVPTSAEKAEIELEFEYNGHTYNIKREISSGKSVASLRRDGKLLESPSPSRVGELIEEILGIDYDLFSRAIYSEQNNLDYFMNLSPGDRKRKIDEILGLDKFEAARKNGTTLMNELEKEYLLCYDEKNRMMDLKIEENYSQVLLEIEEIKGIINELESKIREYEDKKLKIEQDLKTAEEAKKRFEALINKKIELEATIKSLLSEKSKIHIKENLTAEKVEECLKSANKRLSEFEEKKKELSELSKEKFSLEKILEGLKDDISKLEFRIKGFPEPENKKEQLEKKEKELSELEENMANCRAQISNLKKAISSLQSASERCEVCDSELSEKKRQEVLKRKQALVENFEKKLLEFSEKRASLKNEVENLEKELLEILRIEEFKEILKNKLESFYQIEEKIKLIEPKIIELRKYCIEEKLKELNDEIKNLENARRYFALENEENSTKKELQKVLHDLEELKFDEQKLEVLRKDMYEIESKIFGLKEKINAEKRVLKEKENRYEELKKLKLELSELKNRLRSLDHARVFMREFLKALELTQVQLRERFLDEVNQVMEDIWSRIYPYNDLLSIKLDPLSYGIFLKNVKNEWVNANSEVSGGERQCAALALRIALSLLLAPQFRILILDEPTHNLDSRAIEDLADTIRNGVSGLLDQMFLITHEERLESAATGKIYRLRKKGTASGLTEVEEGVIEVS